MKYYKNYQLPTTNSSSKKDIDNKQKEKILNDIFLEFGENTGFSPERIYLDSTAGKNKNALLTAEEFFDMLKNGQLFTDIGAGKQHGHLTHILQIYLLGKYFQKNLETIYNQNELKEIQNFIKKYYPSIFQKTDKISDLPKKIINVFYRLLGEKDFIDAYDWAAFERERLKSFSPNEENKLSTATQTRLNASTLWDQLFDKLGYNSNFSVPSTFGFLQYLGILINFPVLGVPNIRYEKNNNQVDEHLTRVLNITPNQAKLKAMEKNTFFSTKKINVSPEQKSELAYLNLETNNFR